MVMLIESGQFSTGPAREQPTRVLGETLSNLR